MKTSKRQETDFMKRSVIKLNQNLKRAKAIEQKNKQRLLTVNPNLDEGSGIYFLTRENEEKIKFSYVGQARHILSRMCQHMVGYQHIDLSLKRHGLYSPKNPYGWKIGFLHFPISELDEKERYYITQYAKNGYQSRNKDTGGGAGKQELGERKPSRGYRDGIIQGKRSLAKQLSEIIQKHLTVTIRPDKQGNKVSEKQFEKFNQLLDENNYKEDDNG